MTIKEFIGKPVYDSEGQIIMASQKSGHQQMLLDVRGWGAIQNLFKTQKEAMSFQDALGMYITDAINEKLNKPAPTALDLISAEREKQISKGYTVEHDQLFYPECQLAAIASDLCFPYEIEQAPEPPVPINWNPEYWKKLINLPYKDRLRIAGAMIAGELDRVINEEKEEA